jgi:hypothetical protein
MAIIVPRQPNISAQRGLAGLQGFATNLVTGLNQRRRQQTQASELAALTQALQSGGVIDPTLFTDPRVASLAFSTIQQQQDPLRKAQIEQIGAQTALAEAQAGQVGRPTPLDPFTATLKAVQAEKGLAEIAQIGKAPPLSEEEKALKKAQTEQIKQETKQIGLLSIAEQRDAALIKAGLKESVKSQLEIDKTKSEIFKNQAQAAASIASANPDKKLTTQERISTASGFRKEFNSLSDDFTKITDSFNKIKAVSADPSAAGDIALIFNYMKILDPGSTVREGEFATAENAGAIPVRIRNMFNRALRGERLTFNRSDFIRQAENMFNAQKKTHDKLTNRYITLAKKFGIDPDDVVGQPNIDNLPPNNIDFIPLSDEELTEREELLKKAGG